MAGVTHVPPSDPLEIRVLAALMSGAATGVDVAMRTGEPVTLVAPVLEQAVAEQTVTRIAISRTPAYSLTPKGLHAIGVHQGVPAADDPGHVDPEAVPRLVVVDQDAAPAAVDDDAVGGEGAPPAGDTTRDRVPEPGEVKPPAREVTWRHVVYAVAYVLLGLLFLVLLHSVFGLVVVVAGLVLGAFALRPYWRSGSSTH
jgi:hypothetical protein